MTLITACPACQTQFEVTETELQAYAGNVRCGECDHVFDARAHLLAPALATIPPALEADPAVQAVTEVTSDSGVEASSTPSLMDTPVLDVSLPPAADTVPSEMVAPETTTFDGPFSPPGLNETAHTETTPHWTLNTVPEPEVPAFLQHVALTETVTTAPRRRWLQWVMALFSMLLALGLLLQMAYFGRDVLAVRYPALQPVLRTLCASLHCKMALPRDIAQLTIDDVELLEHADREGVLVLSSVLVNHGNLPLALPDIEITLTNTDDQPVIRKWLSPADYLPATTAAAQGIAAQQELPVRVLLAVEAQRVAGFRVALNYPAP